MSTTQLKPIISYTMYKMCMSDIANADRKYHERATKFLSPVYTGIDKVTKKIYDIEDGLISATIYTRSKAMWSML